MAIQLLATAVEPPAPASISDGLACGLGNVIAAIHAVPALKPVRDRFLVLSTGNPQAYVQCLFQDEDSWMLCEASSGRYSPRYLKLGSEQRIKLAVLGFDTLVRTGNYQQAIPTASFTSYVKVGRLMSQTSQTVYATSVDTKVVIYAPLLETSVLDRLLNTGCSPTH